MSERNDSLSSSLLVLVSASEAILLGLSRSLPCSAFLFFFFSFAIFYCGCGVVRVCALWFVPSGENNRRDRRRARVGSHGFCRSRSRVQIDERSAIGRSTFLVEPLWLGLELTLSGSGSTYVQYSTVWNGKMQDFLGRWALPPSPAPGSCISSPSLFLEHDVTWRRIEPSPRGRRRSALFVQGRGRCIANYKPLPPPLFPFAAQKSRSDDVLDVVRNRSSPPSPGQFAIPPIFFSFFSTLRQPVEASRTRTRTRTRR